MNDHILWKITKTVVISLVTIHSFLHGFCWARVISPFSLLWNFIRVISHFLNWGKNVFLQQHSGNCPFEVTWCENKCGAKLERRFIGNHTKNECHKRTVECKYCNRDFVAETLQVLFFIGNWKKFRFHWFKII